jgi:hypothetical protein
MSIPMNVGAGKVGDPGVGRNSLGPRGVNYRICRLRYFTNRTFGGVSLTGKFGAGDFRLRDGTELSPHLSTAGAPEEGFNI